MQWGRIPLLLLQRQQIMFNKQWGTNSEFYLQVLKPGANPSCAHSKGCPCTHMQRDTQKPQTTHRKKHCYPANLHPHAEMCSVHSSHWLHPSPPHLLPVFSNLTMMCCLEGAAVTQVRLLLSEASFSLCALVPVSLNPGLQGVRP